MTLTACEQVGGGLLEDLGPPPSGPVLLCLSDPSLPALLTATRSLHQHAVDLHKAIGLCSDQGLPKEGKGSKGRQVSVPPSISELPEIFG